MKRILPVVLGILFASSAAHATKLYPITAVGDKRLVFDLDTIAVTREFTNIRWASVTGYWCASAGVCVPRYYRVPMSNCGEDEGVLYSSPGNLALPERIDWHPTGTRPEDIIAVDLCVVAGAALARGVTP